ncbi:Fe-S cluster assembly protein SufD [Candidatus Pelagibacter sp. HIMB1483]|uniref:Fe-S cluster assembly protein SufD n=1 Tax=Candidatus Pelagibacter sp. HIMB1483 TaxID=3415414 RepID=UPI003F86D41B
MTEQIKIDFEKTIQASDLSEGDVSLKKKFLNSFITKGFPSKKLENWKFLDISQIIKKDIGELSFFNDYSPINKVDESVFVKDLEHNKIVFINGKVERINFKYEDQDKIEINESSKLEEKFKNSNSLIDLNNAFINKIYKILVKKDYSLKKPLIVYHLTNNEIQSKNINLRLQFQLEQNSSLKLIDFFNHNSEKNFINTFYDFELKKNAILKNYKLDKLQNKNIQYSFNNINQDENSVSETFLLSAGSSFLKNEINSNLNGKYSSAFVNGIFSIKDNQQHEIRTTINHLVENTKSYQLIKSVLEKNSKAAYQGKIFVDQKAQKTDGYQLSRAILLDETSEFNAKPELEIYADDVKCSHGSASGSLDENSIFYLMSRGLSYQQSKELLINGFILEVIENITDIEIKDLIKKMIGFKE